MKALIRNEGETVRETDGIKGIDWITGAPLTNPPWEGGRPYTLIENYVETEPILEYETELGDRDGSKEETIIIGGKIYKMSELRSILG